MNWAQKVQGFFTYIYSNFTGSEPPGYIQDIIVFEVSAVLFGLLVLFTFHKISRYLKSRRLKTQKEIEKRFKYMIKNKVRPGFKFLEENKWTNLELIVPVVEKINLHHGEDLHWLFIMDNLLDQILFPQAREWAMSFFFIKRNWALRCLSLSPRKKDETYFLNFLCDPIAHNRFGAIKPLLEVGSSYSLNVIVEVMEDENRHTQAVFLSMTKFGGDYFYEAIRNRLLHETDPQAKRVCIDILSDSIERSDLFLIKGSLFDKNKSLRLTALRCLGKIEVHQSTQLLMQFLDDELWEVRSISAKMLGQRKSYQAIPKLLEKAYDKNWWVRHNAIHALFEFGVSGNLALETITEEKDKYAYEMLQYVKRVRDEQNKKDEEHILEENILEFNPLENNEDEDKKAS